MNERLSRNNKLDDFSILHQAGFSPLPQKDAQRWEDLFARMERVRLRLQSIDRPPAYWEGVMLLSRAALIFADHKVSSQTYEVSSQTDREPREEGILYANTKKMSGQDAQPKKRRGKPGAAQGRLPERFLDQPLSWHLLEVGRHAAANVRMFTGEGLPTVDTDLVQKVLSTRAEPGSRFAWQDRAVDAVSSLSGGKLIFNVASTGAGKTLANLKMAFAARPGGVRLAVAFNLRSLTTQTFAAFGQHLQNIDAAAFDRDFSCLIGDRGFLPEDDPNEDEDTGDFDEELDLIASQRPVPEWLSRIAQSGGSDDKLAKLIASPVLVSTMDWIVAAGEPGQQDRHAKALIRVANSDLILDEVDSYDVRAAVAVMRVVQTAATFGRNVIVSSATLNPVLAKGLTAAYAAGRRTYEALFGKQSWSLIMTSDQFDPQVLSQPSEDDADHFYRDTMKTMCGGLSQAVRTKRFRLADVPGPDAFPAVIATQAQDLHDLHAMAPAGLSCRLSIGLVRVANVSTCMDVSEGLRQDGRFIVSAYHARDLTERRAWRERHLDRILARGNPAWVDALVEAVPHIRQATGDVRLIVVATPVEEVGRDHDFDWAIIEPSSMHSIIQTGGRVNRHRRIEVRPGQYNIVLLRRNLKDLREPGKICFTHPGLEIKDQAGGMMTHPSHDLEDLMRPCVAADPETNLPSDALDASLIFDEGGRKTTFARYDEDAVAWTTEKVLPVLKRSPGYAMHFMMREYAKNFPLRDGRRDPSYAVNDEVFYAMDNPRAQHQAIWRPTAPNTWLCPDPSAFIDLKDRPAHCDLRDAGTRLHVDWHGLRTT